MPQTTFTLRLSMALFGIAAVALTYAAGRVDVRPHHGLFAAALLAIMPWHLHLSRTAFMVGAWPFIEMAILWALFRARGAAEHLGVRRRRRPRRSRRVHVQRLPAVPAGGGGAVLYDLAAARDRRGAAALAGAHAPRRR